MAKKSWGANPVPRAQDESWLSEEEKEGTGETEWPNMSQTMAAQPCVAETSRHCAVPRAKMNKVTQAASP